MKKLSVLLIALLALSACTKHEVKQIDKLGCTNTNSLNYDPDATINDGSCIATGPTQYGLVIEYTATWCGPCGNWGAPTMASLCENEHTVGIACHADGDPMYDATLYSSLTSCRPDGGGIPSFWIGDQANKNQGTLTTLLARDPDASTVCKASRSGDNVIVTTYVEFLKECTGDYYYSLMITESGIDGSNMSGAYEQNGTANPADYTHQHVLRSAYLDNCYGESIATGTSAAGKMITKNYTLPVDPSWVNDLDVVVVLWKKNGAMFEYVNAFDYAFE